MAFYNLNDEKYHYHNVTHNTLDLSPLYVVCEVRNKIRGEENPKNPDQYRRDAPGTEDKSPADTSGPETFDG